MSRRLHVPAGQTATARSPDALRIDPEDAGWTYSGLRIVELLPGAALDVDTGLAETLVLPLQGSCSVSVGDQSYLLHGRAGVLSGPTDFCYLPRGCSATLTSRDGGRFALPSAVCERELPFRYCPVERVPVELRGAGQASRQVNNFCTPEVFECDRLIACEVLTPAGNWSSYPPHKHDEQRPGESVLEEIYYFEVADGPTGPGIAYQRVYGHERSQSDVLVEVGTGDVVLIPDGWHGPSMAAPGYDLYYLNVMAGPGDERAWRICDDPAHTWVRDTWVGQPVDPRLPFGPARSQP
jgi:5-deoxy-glucuronate isomerase